ncbi:MAG: TrkA family potassium uptake protein [Bacteroidetes bacterium]|nr:TrkA family potassium uptake protein [Bacteroidota bacterium]
MTLNKFAVIGLGLFGTAIARELSKKGGQVIAIDIDEEKVESIKEEVAFAVALDATDIRTIKAQKIQDMDAVVVSIGDNFEALILCTMHLIDLKVKRIIARANSPYQRRILEKAGVTEILSPEETVGMAVAERLINPSIGSFLELPDGHEIVEIKTPTEIVNRNLGEINLRDKYHLNLITIKREMEMKRNGEVVKEQHIMGVPGHSTVLYATDTIVVFGRTKDIQRFIEINQ